MAPAWRFTQCDQNHRWQRLPSSTEESAEEVLRCAFDGLEAVTVSRHPLADGVQIGLIPAAWEVDGQVGMRDEWFLQLSDADCTRSRRSGRFFRWADLLTLIEWFRGLAWADPELSWRRAGLHEPAARGELSG